MAAEDLLVRIDATTEQLRRELRRADMAVNQGAGRIDRELSRVDRRFDALNRSATFATRAIGGFIAAFSVAALTRFSTQQLAAADAIGKAADVASVTTDTLQELRYVFGQLANVADKEVDMALQRFNRRLGLARQGSGEAKAAFEEMFGGSDQFANTEQALDAVMQRLSQMEDDAQRAAYASRFFGEEAGPRLAAALGQGGGAVAQLRQDAQDLGIILDRDVVENAATIRDEFDKSQRILSTSFMSALNQATPLLVKMAEAAGRVADFLTTTELESLTQEMDSLRDKQQQLLNELSRPRLLRLNPFISDESITEQVNKINERLIELQKRQQALLNPAAPDSDITLPPVTVTGSDDGAEREMERLREQTERRLQMIRESLMSERELEVMHYEEKRAWLEEVNEEFFESETERLELLEELRSQHQDRLTEIDAKGADQRAQIEEHWAKTVSAMRMGVFSDFVSLLRAMPGESKAAAIAMLAVEKGLRIAETYISTQAAAARAMAEIPYPGNFAVAAQVEAMGKVRMGLIAATGLAQAASMGGGGSSGGGSSGSRGSSSSAPAREIAEPEEERIRGITLQVNTRGRRSRFTADEVEDMLTQIVDLTKDGGGKLMGVKFN